MKQWLYNDLKNKRTKTLVKKLISNTDSYLMNDLHAMDETVVIKKILSDRKVQVYGPWEGGAVNNIPQKRY